MNVYEKVLAFKGSWRNYQTRVLNASETYLGDGKIHIVAAPGAGKTTLGIELIRRIGKPCMILSPRIVIRQQWLERIRESFLMEKSSGEQILSGDIRSLRLITSITYQTLFHSMNRANEVEKEEDSQEEAVDYSEFDLIAAVKRAGIGTICLDECHHLKNEWWKALENFMRELPEVTVIALTATPPYDASPSEWERYHAMCGPVDEEISVPELVREGSLCPHQDYVYFNYPSKEEEQQIKKFRDHASDMYQTLMKDEILQQAVSTHRGLVNVSQYTEKLLEDPAYLASLLIYCHSKSISYHPQWLKILNVKTLPPMSERWMEVLLQGFLYTDAEEFQCEDSYRNHLLGVLKSAGLIERKKVGFLENSKIEKMLIQSKGKLKSISEIADTEFSSMKKDLRMLILTDYIRKEYSNFIGNPQKEIDSMGVLPVFEMLRRQNSQWKLAVLCGSMIILPDDGAKFIRCQAKELGMEISARALYDKEGRALGYSEIMIQGKIHLYAKMVTDVFEKGMVQILIGTKSLLGEGWDSPSINSLILASFVGSYVLSNQMRGRAIRAMASNPDKTSNIWHLVCLAGEKEQKVRKRMNQQEPELTEDYRTLERRMKGFYGVNYEGTSIENGIERLSIIKPPYTQSNIRRINKSMRELSCERERLRCQWKKAVFYYEKMEPADECAMDKGFLKTGAYFFYSFGAFLTLLFLQMINTLQRIRFQSPNPSDEIIFLGITVIIIWAISVLGKKMIRMIGPLKRLDQIGKGVLEALKTSGKIMSECKVVTEDDGGVIYMASLKGGSGREKALFADCLEDFLRPIDNQRYLLYAKKGRISMEKFYCVPSEFSKTKEDAVLFLNKMKPYLGSYELIYTRSPEGRRILLRGRAKAFANKNDRFFQRKKKIKSALE